MYVHNTRTHTHAHTEMNKGGQNKTELGRATYKLKAKAMLIPLIRPFTATRFASHILLAYSYYGRATIRLFLPYMPYVYTYVYFYRSKT